MRRSATFVVAWLLTISPSSANMPGTFQPLMLSGTGTPISCSGGTHTVAGGRNIFTFTASGTFTCTGTGSFLVDYLVVAGGGGGSNDNGAGGGAGGFVSGSATISAA